jgi:hypothetical protein
MTVIPGRSQREALTVSCPGRGGRCTAEPGPKIAKTTPCKVRTAPAQQRTATVPRPGHEKKRPISQLPPKLIPL